MHMQDIEMVEADTNHTKAMAATPNRARKKKGMLTKLKEKKEREFGSNLSFQTDALEDKNNSSPEENLKTNKNTSELSDVGLYYFSTKDNFSSRENSPEKQKSNRPPKPKPRIRRDSLEKPSIKVKQKESPNNSDFVEVSDFDFKQTQKENDSPTSIPQNSLVPKPPSTPRTPGSTPRTPRGYTRSRTTNKPKDLPDKSLINNPIHTPDTPYPSSPRHEHLENGTRYSPRSKRRLSGSDEIFPKNESETQRHNSTGSLSDYYRRILDNDKAVDIQHVKNSSNRPEANKRSTFTPPGGRLHPISPRSIPPPFQENFSSQPLRTSYKIDSNVIRPSTNGSVNSKVKSDGSSPSNIDKLSQNSFNTGSVLPVITTKEARSRSYLEGSISSGAPSLLGNEELDRYFPDRKVNILVATWNMNELKTVDTNILNDLVLPERCQFVQDIYAVGTQENGINKKEWETQIQETLGPSHVMYHSVSLGALHLVVFIRRDLIWFCSTPEDDVLSLRAVTMVKTKGAIGVAFSLFGTSYLFINCHLTSDRDNDNSKKKHRLGDYLKVIQDMKLPKNSNMTKKNHDITSLFDCVFWLGDLNFRIERKRHAVEGKVHEITAEEFPNFETLLGGDQLHKYMMEGKIFCGFQEGRINFHPTFKFDINKDSYDSSYKNRVPSYTDRVLFRSKKKNDVTCLYYDAVMAIRVSDHRPVYCQFETGIKPGADSTVFAAGHFDRAVYLEANRRRASKSPVKKRQSSICSVQ